jgi:hypothetical protein
MKYVYPSIIILAMLLPWLRVAIIGTVLLKMAFDLVKDIKAYRKKRKVVEIPV